jgi:hypothetical protein
MPQSLGEERSLSPPLHQQQRDSADVVTSGCGIRRDSLEPPQSVCNSDDVLSVVSRYSDVPC